jgi:mono/diheme cytochrome c family protein
MKKNKKLLFLTLLLLVTGLFSVTAFQSFTPADKITGEDIYRLNCAGCHGVDRDGIANLYPSLVNINERMTKEQVSRQIDNGKGLMPPFAHLSQNEKEALVSFLYNERIESIEGSLSNMGEGIFKSNCTSCHRLFADDPKPTNARMMEPPPLAGITHKISKGYFLRTVENGKCYMPSFNHFSAEEKEELYSYLNSFEYQGRSSRKHMHRGCSRRMGMMKNQIDKQYNE